jgi:hypothetical protein
LSGRVAFVDEDFANSGKESMQNLGQLPAEKIFQRIQEGKQLLQECRRSRIQSRRRCGSVTMEKCTRPFVGRWLSAGLRTSEDSPLPEKQHCPLFPKVTEADPEKLYMVTTNCGTIVDKISKDKLNLFPGAGAVWGPAQ